MLIGGLQAADPVLERPGQISNDDFVGCVHSVSVNGRALNLSSPLHSRGVDATCGRPGSVCQAARSVGLISGARPSARTAGPQDRDRYVLRPRQGQLSPQSKSRVNVPNWATELWFPRLEERPGG